MFVLVLQRECLQLVTQSVGVSPSSRHLPTHAILCRRCNRHPLVNVEIVPTHQQALLLRFRQSTPTPSKLAAFYGNPVGLPSPGRPAASQQHRFDAASCEKVDMGSVKLALVRVVKYSVAQRRNNPRICDIGYGKDQPSRRLKAFFQRSQYLIRPSQMLQHITGQNGVKASSSNTVQPVGTIQVAFDGFDPQRFQGLQCCRVVLHNDHLVTARQQDSRHGTRTRAEFQNDTAGRHASQHAGSPCISIRIESVVVSLNVYQRYTPLMTDATSGPTNPNATIPRGAPEHPHPGAELPDRSPA